MFANLTGWHALIILGVVVLIFGAAKLPALARSLGQSVRILQKEVKNNDQAEKEIAADQAASTEPGASLPSA